MKKFLFSFSFFLFFASAQSQSGKILSDSFYQQLALRWAPIHVQDVQTKGKDGLAGLADYITATNYDGDWNMDNNWENLDSFCLQLSAHCYYSIVQTSTHWFISYSFYHPRDWTNKFLVKKWDTHENDLEGLLTIIRRPKNPISSGFGELQGMLTVFHMGFYSFVPKGSPLQANKRKIAGEVVFWNFNQQAHPVSCQQARGHGLKAYPHIKITKPDHIIYYPSLDRAQRPKNVSDDSVYYKLIDIFEPQGLWSRRGDPQTFVSPTAGFTGSHGGYAKAKPPWVWDSSLDGKTLTGGELATDPVRICKWYFKGFDELSEDYELNLFLNN